MMSDDSHTIAHLFLSYRSEERGVALRVATGLKKKGVRIWMDALDASICVGDDWVQQLESALNSAAGLISILSTEYISSKYCRRELRRADALGIPIYPILLNKLDRHQWPLEIQEKQYLDFTEWRDDTFFDGQVDELFKVLSARFASQIMPAPDLETAYLLSLIADLEAKRGVREFVELHAATHDTNYRIPPKPDDEWGYSILEMMDDENNPIVSRGSVSEIYGRVNQFVLLGEPGGGKTTTIRRFALEAARGRLAAAPSSPLPIVRYLPSWRPGEIFSKFIRPSGWPSALEPLELLKKGDAILFLDGLNEIGDLGWERQLSETLRDWIKQDGKRSRVVITCRARDYTEEKTLGSLPTVRLESLTEKQIIAFSDSYLERKAGRFLKELLDSPQRPISALAHNPYMLCALIYLFSASPNETLPRNSGSLFKKMLRALWERERQRNTKGWVPFEEVESLFSPLAFSMIGSGGATSVPLSKVSIRKPLLYAATSSQFCETDEGLFRFSHQLVRDYFAAVELRRLGVLSVIQRPKRTIRRQFKYVGDWDFALQAYVGIAPADALYVDEIAKINPNVLGIWAKSIDQQSQPLIYEHLIEALRRCLLSEDWDIRMGAAEALGEVGNERAVPWLANALTDGYGKLDGGGYEYKIIYPVRAVAARALGEIGHESAIPALKVALRDEANNWATPNLGNFNAAMRILQALERIGTDEALSVIASDGPADAIEHLADLKLRSTS